jgi:hypothetical protein
MTESGRRATPVLPSARVGVAPRGAHPAHPERFWVSNGFERRPRAPRRRSALYLVFALLVFWGFAALGAVMLLIVFGRWFWSA